MEAPERMDELSPELDAELKAIVSRVADPAAPELPVEEEPPLESREELEHRRQAMRALYGPDFPLASEDQPKTGDWADWAKSLWDRHTSGKRKRLHLVERNRLFRRGVQWISSQALTPWREPPKPKDAVRAVVNLIAPALDQRVQLINEMRPGWKVKPTNQYDRDDRKLATACQLALEYQYDQQNMPAVRRESTYWNGTDGVAFWMVYWDADAGPWHEELEYRKDPETGEETDEPVLDNETGEPMVKARYPMGDIRTRGYRIEQVCVSANATASSRPWYWVIKETISLAEAVAFHGSDIIRHAQAAKLSGDVSMGGPGWRIGSELPEPNDLLEDQETVDRYIVFCEKSEFLPDGLTVVAVGDREVAVSDLLCGMVPMVRVPDGSTDPAFFSDAVMENWIDHQMRINVLYSKWIESIRANAGGRFAAKPKTLATETLQSGLFSLMEVRGPGPIGDNLMPIPGFSVGVDAKELLALTRKDFENVSFHNDSSRGSFSSDASGRAILASREALERGFAEPLNAIASAMTEWGKICIAWMKWGYDLPRQIAVTGKSRPDLGMSISKDDFDGVADVHVDPQTLVPMPDAYRQYMLDQYLQKGAINMKQYLQRQRFGFIDDLEQPDDDHGARAQRVVQAIKDGAQPQQLDAQYPIYWQDNEAIHQDVIEREIILTDQFPPQIVAVADYRWKALAQQASMKAQAMMGGAPPGGPGGTPPAPKGQGSQPKSPFAPGPGSSPVPAQNPGGLPIAPQHELSGMARQEMAGKLFDKTRAQ